MDQKKLVADIDRLIDIALAEDIGQADVSSQALIDPSELVEGRFCLREWTKLAGLVFLEKIFQKVDPTISVELHFSEGAACNAGAIIATVKGPALGIFAAERVALNCLQHSCGVATTTAIFLERIREVNAHCDLLDTRKTLPGLRALEKYAVFVAGGKNHRTSLDERFIITKQHLQFIGGKKPILEAVRRARAFSPRLPVEIEVSSPQLLDAALEAKPDIVMLSHFTPSELEAAVLNIRAADPKIYIEASGVELIDHIAEYAQTNIDGLLISALTHSTQDADIAFQITKKNEPFKNKPLRSTYGLASKGNHL